MPIYVHKCPHCPAKEVTVEYSMSFVGDEEKLPPEQWEAVHCTPHNCKCKNKKTHSGELWPRVPQVPQLAGSSGGVFKSEAQLLKDKQAQRKLRSRLHFKNEVMPTLKGGEKRHFEKKLKNLPNQDHEKMK